MPMTIVVTRNLPGRFRGFLASSMCEIAPGVYTAPRMNAGVRERVWAVLEDWFEESEERSVLMTWPDEELPGGQVTRTLGIPRQELVVHEGVYFARREVNSTPQTESSTAASLDWARALVTSKGWCVLDLETTGLGEGAEPIEIAVMSADGELEASYRIRPTVPIEPGAGRTHQIEPASLLDAPLFEQIEPLLREILADRTVVAWNAAFDRKVLARTCACRRLEPLGRRWECALRRYGDWRKRRPSLRLACEIEGIQPIGCHSAAGDARLTWLLIRRMAGEVP